ncbi:hypothetical protein BCR35DRAFT_329734 [Leucosporidium creatinivorum]|uniref:BTB domain-containing protein n=1 Tax=Leucosporidium creatinivorum TaxID=106004 RepID=A0A1Y2FXQ5_9BASI|nr:hypothetical protein BCR35DRAFT_329734 [Leucosporidium creatinivorum]
MTRSISHPTESYTSSNSNEPYTFRNSTSCEQTIRLAIPPFNQGSWTILFAPLPYDEENPSDPGWAWCRIAWTGAEPAEVLSLSLAVESSEGVAVKHDLLGGPAARWPTMGIGKIELVVKGLGAYCGAPVLEAKTMQRGKSKKGSKKLASSAAFAVQGACTLNPPLKNDIRLVFSSNRDLLANTEFLISHSECFKTVINFEDTSRSIQKGKKRSAGTPSAPLCFEDSDEEKDQSTGLTLPRLSQDSDIVYDNELVITEASYSTYKALLIFLQTRRIHFAQLSSTKNLLNSFIDTKTLFHSTTTTNSSLLPPASPKSIYRLADFLSLPSLCTLALHDFSSQLTVSNVMHELFSDVAHSHDQLLMAALAFAVLHVGEVRRSRGFGEVQRRGREGGLEAQERKVVGLLESLEG